MNYPNLRGYFLRKSLFTPEAFDDAEPETRRMIIARLVERIDIGADYSISIRFRISMKQYTGDVA